MPNDSGQLESDNGVESNLKRVADQLGIEVADWARKMTPEEIQWLLDHCPFGQFVSGGGAEPLEKVIHYPAPSSNWPIVDYGDAMTTSPGPYIYGGGYFRVSSGESEEDEDQGGSGIVNPGKGTIVNQAFLTAQDIVAIAQKNNWASIHVVDCHRMLGRAVWIYGEKAGMIITGFEPDEKDIRVEQLLSSSSDEINKRRSFARGAAG